MSIQLYLNESAEEWIKSRKCELWDFWSIFAIIEWELVQENESYVWYKGGNKSRSSVIVPILVKYLCNKNVGKIPRFTFKLLENYFDLQVKVLNEKKS